MNIPHPGDLPPAELSTRQASAAWLSYLDHGIGTFGDRLREAVRSEPGRAFSALITFHPPVEDVGDTLELLAASARQTRLQRSQLRLRLAVSHLARSNEIHRWLFGGDPPHRRGGVAVEAPASTLLRLSDSDNIASFEQEMIYQTCLYRVGEIVKCNEAFKSGLSGRGVTVAVIDTGIDADHPAFSGRISKNSRSFVRGSDPRDITDRQGHGTHVAGIIAGDGSPRGRFRGIAPAAELLVLKVSDFGEVRDIEVIDALTHAIEHGADIINLSLGFSPWNPPFEQLRPPWVWSAEDTFEEAAINGIVATEGKAVVVSAGNEGQLADSSTIRRPGICQHALTVGSVDLNSESPSISSFSARGPVIRSSDLGSGTVDNIDHLGTDSLNYFSKPDVVAPGGGSAGKSEGHETAPGFDCKEEYGVVSAMAASAVSTTGAIDEAYIPCGGTSMSSPTVSGIAALIIEFTKAEGLDLQSRPQRAFIIHNLIRATARNLSLPKEQQGFGLVDWDSIQRRLRRIQNGDDFLENYIRRPVYPT